MPTMLLRLPLSNGAILIASGWTAPIIQQNFHLLSPSAQRQAIAAIGQQPGVTAPPGSFLQQPGTGAASTAGAGAQPLTQPPIGPNTISNALGQVPTQPGRAGPDYSGIANLNAPQIQGQGRGFRIGPAERRLVLPRRDRTFAGLNTVSPDTKLPEGTSPRMTNWNSFRVPGSLCLRSGLGRLLRDILTLNPGGTFQNGIGAIPIVALDPSAAADSCLMLQAFAEASLASANTSGNVKFFITIQRPAHGFGKSVEVIAGPDISSLTDAGGQTVAYVISGQDVPFTRAESIIAITIAFSQIGFVTDPEALKSDRTDIKLELDRIRWDGIQNKTGTITGLVAGTLFMTTWAWSFDGRSKASFRKVTVA